MACNRGLGTALVHVVCHENPRGVSDFLGVDFSRGERSAVVAFWWIESGSGVMRSPRVALFAWFWDTMVEALLRFQNI